MHEVEYIGARGEFSRRAKICCGIGVLAVVLVVFMQWFLVDTHSLTMAAAPHAIASNEEVEGGQYSEFALTAKALIKSRWITLEALEESDQKELKDVVNEELRPLAVSRTERFRFAIVAGDLLGKEEALAILASLEKEVDRAGSLATDIVWLRIHYSGVGGTLTPEARDSLITRHSWFGKLATSYGLPGTDPVRRAAVTGGKEIERIDRRLTVLNILMFLGGVGALFWAVSMRQEAKVVTDLGDIAVADSHLEAFVLFCIAFVIVDGLMLLPFGLGAEGTRGAMVFGEVIMWSLAACAIWPLIRGVKPREFCEGIGLHAGKGVPIELGWGILGFFAWAPVTFGLSFLISLCERLFSPEGSDKGPTGFPMFQQPSSDDPLIGFLTFIGAVIWAPLVEETVFRGLLFGWMRERFSFLLSAIVVSITFGVIHPYSPLGMVQVGISGLLFAMLREWRGSLIAPITAHALHNGFIALSSYMITHAIGG